MIKELVNDLDELAKRTTEFDVLADDQSASIRLVQDLCDTLNSLDRLWLSANQIGYSERAFAVKFNEETEVFMNPAIQKKDKLILFREIDPMTNKEYIIPRFTDISLVFQDCTGQIKGFKMNEAMSIIVCQALDALNGIFPSDYGLEVDSEFDNASEEEKSEVLAAYVSSFEKGYSDLDKELSTDEETSKVWNKAKFVSAFARGDIETEPKPLSNRKKKKLMRFQKKLKEFGGKLIHGFSKGNRTK